MTVAEQLAENGWTARELFARDSDEVDRIRRLLAKPISRFQKSRLKKREADLMDEIAELHRLIAAERQVRQFPGSPVPENPSPGSFPGTPGRPA